VQPITDIWAARQFIALVVTLSSVLDERFPVIVGAMVDLPDGVVTFVFTDIEGSTRLWDDAPDTMMSAIQQHDDAIDKVVSGCNGVSVKPRGEGDSRFIVFADASDAVAAVSEIQTQLSTIEWVTPRPIRVRASVHTGAADLQLGDYYGSAVNRAARLRAIAHGGQTVISGTTWELVQDDLPNGLTATDMGDHALKDLTRPEHVFQLNPPGLPASFPPLSSLDAVPNNLPQQLTEFVGRDVELADAKSLLTKTRLLTILAAGGTGKTRLAIQVAADMIGEYPDGVFFIGLADISTPEDIVQTISESIGVAFSADDEPLDQLLKYLANKSQLLVFDNFEHVVESATIVSGILRSAPDVAVIATSRSKLNVSGETVLSLGGLQVASSSPERVLETSGARLFLDAARRADAGFTLDTQDLDGLARILVLTGGMPLGILLAAAWVDTLPIAEIAEEIAKSLDFLETEMGDVPDRHRSIRAVFDYSWALLSPEEQQVFAALSSFRGGFSREAAQKVANASIRTLATLVNKSLVTPNAAKNRYAVHELLRQYAESELSQDDERYQQVHLAHCEFYAEFLESASNRIFTTLQAETLETIESDLENVRGAWRYAVVARDAEMGRKVVIPALILYEIRGWYPAGVSLFDDGVKAFSDRSGSTEQRVVGAMSAAFACYFRALLGQPDVEAVTAANEVLRDSDDTYGYWTAMQGVAITMAFSGNPAGMVETTNEMIAVGETFEDPFWAAAGKNWRSLAAMLSEDIDTARRLLPQAMEVYQERGEHYYMTWNLWLRARIATSDARPDDAIALLARQVESCRCIGYRRGLMVGLEGLAQAQEAAGNLQAAEQAYRESIATAEATGIVSGVLTMMAKTARVQALLGRPDEAVSHLASVIAEPMSAHQSMADTSSARAIAEEILEEIRPTIDGSDYEAAYKSGAAVPYEVAAKQLTHDLN
jgi:predicted ATPase/class 3 adenylate cyclase